MIPVTAASSYNIYSDKSGRNSYDYDEPDNQDWGRVFRLVFISGLATLASMGNIFTISAIIGDDLLRKKGNSFLASITLADLLITTLVLPASSVAILGQMEDSETICRLQYGVMSISCITAAIFTAAIGIENFLRLKSVGHIEKTRERQQLLRRESTAPVSRTAVASPRHPPHHLLSSPPHTSFPLNHYQHHHQNHSSSSPASHHLNNSENATTSFSTIRHASPLPPEPSPPPPPLKASICTVFQVTLLNLKMWIVSGVIVLIHFIFLPQLMYSICGKSIQTTSIAELKIPKTPKPIDQQLLLESIAVLGVCLLGLVSLGGLGFLKCAFIIRGWKKPTPYLTSRELALVASNCWNCLARFLIWAPSIVSVILIQFHRTLESKPIPSYNFEYSSVPSSGTSIDGDGSASGYSPFALSLSENPNEPTRTSVLAAINSEYSFLHKLLIWPMILPSCLSSLVNVITNQDFRRCYIQLFHYCCCKTSVALSRRPREATHGSDVRVHIIPGYNMYSSHEVSTQPRFTTFKFGPHSSRNAGGSSGKRDVYEL